jgi:hypothetical protein
MKSFFFVSIYFLLSINLNAQTITGVVLDKESNKPIPFVSIGIINNAQGVYAYTDGRFEMRIIKFRDSDSLRFSCIGYEPITYRVSDFIAEYNAGLDIILLTKSITELAEVEIEGKRDKSRKIGNKISSKNMIFLFNSLLERGIIIESDDELFLKSVSFKLTMARGVAPDSAVFRFNIYKLKDGLPHENILKKPIYFYLKKNKFEGSNKFDLTKYNINIDEDFAATFELVEQNGGSEIYFSGWYNGNRSVGRIGSQGAWLDALSDDAGEKMYQSLEIEVLYNE